ncbi:FUSC family protein [Variovorax sp. KK3]|uniref:FUSC family protein n=1 Tax=Variovorax sp. KK3 TaxID=1855728 RepID=UPI00097CAD22|nr:FUSC family protein [Variovorax sp. KK3]
MRARPAALIDRAKTLGAELWQEFRAPARARERALEEAEAVLSVLLAIVLAHAMGAEHIGWAAFSGYMVLRARLAESLARGGLRIAGTALGAAAGFAASSVLGQSLPGLSAALALVGGVTLYGALTQERGLAWLFAGVTFSMVVLDSLVQPFEDVTRFAATRVLEVAAGTIASLAVGALSALTLRPRILPPAPDAIAAPRQRIGWHREAALHSLQAAVAFALAPLLVAEMGERGVSQAVTTIAAVMLVPLASLGNVGGVGGAGGGVTARLLQRFAGCLAGAGVAALALLLTQHHLLAMLLCVGLVVAVGRHVENSGKRFAYAGTQFAIAFLVVFVPDSYTAMSAEPGLQRLAGIVAGIALLQVVRIVFGSLVRLRAQA